MDPNGFGSVGGMEAARFLKRSGLSDVILSKIWDLSDPGGRGCLDKTGMFVALKLVALVQNGKELNITNVTMDLPPPKMVKYFSWNEHWVLSCFFLGWYPVTQTHKTATT